MLCGKSGRKEIYMNISVPIMQFKYLNFLAKAHQIILFLSNLSLMHVQHQNAILTLETYIIYIITCIQNNATI